MGWLPARYSLFPCWARLGLCLRRGRRLLSGCCWSMLRIDALLVFLSLSTNYSTPYLTTTHLPTQSSTTNRYSPPTHKQPNTTKSSQTSLPVRRSCTTEHPPLHGPSLYSCSSAVLYSDSLGLAVRISCRLSMWMGWSYVQGWRVERVGSGVIVLGWCYQMGIFFIPSRYYNTPAHTCPYCNI